MSTTTVKRALASAIADAEAFRDLFPADCYESWTFAGSVRRGRPEVGDIEHVVIPRFGEVDVSGMLFAEKKTVNLLWYRLDDLVKAQRVEQHVYSGSNPATGVYTPTAFRWGEKYRGCDFRGFCHELFTADADNFGSVLAIRTGPGGYSKMLVTRLQYQGYWNNRGYVWDKRQLSCTCGWSGGWDDARLTGGRW